MYKIINWYLPDPWNEMIRWTDDFWKKLIKLIFGFEPRPGHFHCGWQWLNLKVSRPCLKLNFSYFLAIFHHDFEKFYFKFWTAKASSIILNLNIFCHSKFIFVFERPKIKCDDVRQTSISFLNSWID